MDDKKLLTIKELTKYLSVGETSVRKLLRSHHGFAVRIGNRWYANKSLLDKWLDERSL